MHFVFMGVSGSGKTTVAEVVAERLNLPFAEADHFHPQANIAKMSSGVALTDDDRRPWLESLAAWIGEHEARGQATIMACSALKRAYRDILRQGAPDVRFVHLAGSVELIAQRLRSRTDHFMPGGLLESQAATLEPLAPDEDGVTLDLAAPIETSVAEGVRVVSQALDLRDPAGS
ncbi:gluconokinase [Salinactinospora qingdaonensis]|uniref:Gluconokinase n=1 Tax=Salinactinospora qingdaonensis TaxID=702744 RepID=A0ABP7FV76_9ACTN